MQHFCNFNSKNKVPFFLPTVNINGNISKNKVIDIAILAYTLAFFLKRTVLKSSHTPNGRILSRHVFLEIASYSVVLLGDEAVAKIFKKIL